jgi:hypothetical protein
MNLSKKFMRGVLAGAMVLLLTGCGPTSDEMFADVSNALDANLSKDFTELTFEAQLYTPGMQPALVFGGKNSKILAVTKPVRVSRLMAGDEVKMSGLAVTNNGRYVTFTYESSLELWRPLPFMPAEPCLQADCRSFREKRFVSRGEAMTWLYYSDAFTPERFKELFGEDAPPKRVEA